MNLDFSDNQQSLDELAGKLCDDLCAMAHVRDAETEATMCVELWQNMCEAGLAGLIIPEEHGGAGFSLLDAVPLYEQLGRHLAATPHFSSSIVSALLLMRALQSGNPAVTVISAALGQIATGNIIISPAWLEPNGGFLLKDVNLVACKTENGYRLKGEKVHVPFALVADKFLVLARLEDNAAALCLFLVDTEDSALIRKPAKNFAGDAQGHLIFNDMLVPDSACLSPDEDATALWSDTLNAAIILDAAYAVGLADRALEITVEFAKGREQFDQPIAAFQAISHPLVDNRVAIDGAKTLVYEAAWAQSEGISYRTLAMMAALFAKDTARDVTARCEQVHGGIGFTLEYDIQLFYRRAKQMQLNWYDKRTLETKIAELALDEGETWSGPDPFTPSDIAIAALSERAN